MVTANQLYYGNRTAVRGDYGVESKPVCVRCKAEPTNHYVPQPRRRKKISQQNKHEDAMMVPRYQIILLHFHFTLLLIDFQDTLRYNRQNTRVEWRSKGGFEQPQQWHGVAPRLVNSGAPTTSAASRIGVNRRQTSSTETSSSASFVYVVNSRLFNERWLNQRFAFPH